jgi:hypothetical protein
MDEKLARAREAKAARDEKRRARGEALELEALELEERFETELGGPRGVKFEIVSNDLGNFLIRRGEFVAHKRFNAKGKDVTEEDVFQLVLPAIAFPERESAQATFREHAGIAWDCVVAMQAMYRAKRGADQGK